MTHQEINIRDIYRVLRKRVRFVLLTAVLMGVGTYYFTVPPAPVYEAETLVKVSRNATLAGLMVDLISYSPYDNMATQVMVVTSQPILQEVAERLIAGGLAANPDELFVQLKAQVSAEQRSGSDILAIKAIASSPQHAILIANTTAAVFIDHSTADKKDKIDEMLQFVRRRATEAQDELDALQFEMNDYRRANALVLATNPTTSFDIQERRFQYEQKLRDVSLALEAVRNYNRWEERYVETARRKARALAASPVGTFERPNWYNQEPGSPTWTEERSAEPVFAGPELKDNLERLLTAYIPADDPMVRTLSADLIREVSAIIEFHNKREELLGYQTPESPEVKQLNQQVDIKHGRLKAVIASLIRRLESVQRSYERFEDNLKNYQAEIYRHPEVISQLESLQNQLKSKSEQALTLQKQLQEAEIQYREQVNDLTLVERANNTSQVSNSSRTRSVLVGIIIGLLVGGIFAFVQESLDTSIGTIEEVEKYIGSPVLGVIPHINLKDVRDRIPVGGLSTALRPSDLDRFARLATHFDPNSVAAEAYRILRTQVLSYLGRSNAKSMMVTSSALAEGKTTTAVNLAVAMAQADKKVLLIDADLRRPTVDKIFGLEKAPGLVDVLNGTKRFTDCVRKIDDLIVGRYGAALVERTPGLENLFILTAGEKMAHPAELLSSANMDRIIQEAHDMFDFTLLDLSPVLPVADASIMAPKVDGVILSYQIGRIGRELLKRCKSRLEGLGANIWGILLNDIQAEIDYWPQDYRYYSYRYSHHQLDKKGWWTKVAGNHRYEEDEPRPIRPTSRAHHRDRVGRPSSSSKSEIVVEQTELR